MAWLLRKRQMQTEAPRTPSDRRAGYRQSHQASALLMPSTGAAFEVTVLDVSPLGLSFRCAEHVSAGSSVAIKFATPETRNVVYSVLIRGSIAWMRHTRRVRGSLECGMTFGTMSLQEHVSLIRFFLEQYGLRFSDPEEKRASVRLSLKLSLPLQMETRGGAAVSAHLKDISINGIGFISSEPLDIGETLTLSMKTGEEAWVDCEAVVTRLHRRPRSDFEVGATFNVLGESQKAHLVETLTRMGRPPLEEILETPRGRPFLPGGAAEEDIF
jgi:hypothetical protein